MILNIHKRQPGLHFDGQSLSDWWGFAALLLIYQTD